MNIVSRTPAAPWSSVAWFTGRRPAVDATALFSAAILFMVVFDNDRLWSTLFGLVGMGKAGGWSLLFAFGAVMTAATAVVAAPFSHPSTVRPVMSLLLLVSAVVSFYQDRVGIIVDESIVRSMLETDVGETRELLTLPFALHIAAYGLLPIAIIAWTRVKPRASLFSGLLISLATCCAALILLIAAFWLGYKPITVASRQHNELRMLVNPLYALYSAGEVIANAYADTPAALTRVGEDAVSSPTMSGKPRVLVLVVGETARADHFAMNGYERATTPRMSDLDVLSFTDVRSCGTATTVSVPCMFSPRQRRDFNDDVHSENLLHVLRRAGVGVTWRDNNTGCKGVCEGFDYHSFRHASDPRLCDAGGCLDEILLSGLDKEIREHERDLLIVLHQEGSHGPAYFRRYPGGFDAFTPECRSESPWECSTAALTNSYDNSILYTDYFLSRVIDLLRSFSAERETTMLYVSDHGESLGENGLYLHGLPYAIAPDEQTSVPMLFWQGGAGSGRGDRECLQARAHEPASHDNVFHTVLGLFAIRTDALSEPLNLLSGCRQSARIADRAPGGSAPHAPLEHALAAYTKVR